MKHIWFSSLIQVLFAVAVVVLAVVNTWSGLYEDARKTSANATARMNDIVEGYVSDFRCLLIPIEKKIAENPSFDEMQAWLQSQEEVFRAAVGEDAYDGIALTYKGGYAHSWNYGDYSDYDPATRPWYQAAQAANGDIAVVPPYVTYLSADNQAVDTDILMTIAQKYNEEISFDLDLKLPRIQGILQEVKSLYAEEEIFICNQDGQILSSTSEAMFAHNIFRADEAVSEGLAEMVQKRSLKQNVLQLGVVDGRAYHLYFSTNEAGSTICIMAPTREIFLHDFLFILLICLALLGCVAYIFLRNRRNVIEFVERDRRLDVIEDSEQKERLYVDADHMRFYGNAVADAAAENDDYEALYQQIGSRLAEPTDRPRMDAFLSPEAIRDCARQPYVIQKERFVMDMPDKDGAVKRKTIEMRRLAFVQGKTNIVEIAAIDAAESVDLLKEALETTSRLKQEMEEEYNRFMGYICTAQDGVEELCIAKHTITRYSFQNGVLQTHTVSYPGMPFALFHEEDRAKAHELYDEDKLAVLCDNRAVSYAELRMKWNDAAEYHWCNVIVLGMPRTEKTPFNVLVLIKDTNEIKTKEVQQRHALEDAFHLAEQGSKAKGSFLSNMSHEIRTPLNAIIGYLTIAADSDCTADKKDYCIANCQTASRHLLQIINDVLDMSSIENGKLKIAHEPFDLKKEISDITAIFYQNARMKQVEFETHVENVTEEWVVGDQLRVNQVLMNLLSNAVKFTPEGGRVLLKVEQLRRDSQNVYMRFTVKDSGIGMSKEYMSRIFHPFEQENASTAKKFGGSGLGLSITNNLVHMMGGKIDVTSTQGEGTTFEVTIFFNLSADKHESTVHADFSHVRVLVVDDKPDECTYAKMMLKRCGVKADSVTDGEAALKRIRARKDSDYAYNLCIIDWNMPQMDGCEVTRKIREEMGDTLPIIIATAYDVSALQEQALAAGANKVVAKPLFQSSLFDILVTSFGGYDPAAKAGSTAVNLQGIRLLLAEDNAMNMDIAVTILEKAGVKVDQARDGREAVDKFLAAPADTYAVILMDVQMPVLDGYEATRMIRESKHPRAKTIPIVAMTANAFAEDVTQALARGMNAHIAKPVSYQKLFAVLKQFSETNDEAAPGTGK